MAHFYSLTVTATRFLTRSAVEVTLCPSNDEAQHFSFIQGQYLTLRREFEGEEIRRCYSICSQHGSGEMQIGIKHVADGIFSNWANSELKVGDTLESLPPMGRFHSPLMPEEGRLYLLFAAGSGITPVLGVLRTVLAKEQNSRLILVYSNRTVRDIMFREDIEDLKNKYMDRLSVIHILTSDRQEVDLFSGRIDQEKLKTLFSSLIPVSQVDQVFVCGPEPLTQLILQSLTDHGIADDRIKYELFLGNKPRKQAVATVVQRTDERVQISITLDGATRILDMPKNGQTVLEAALEAGMDAPFSCRAGVCATCRARVQEGEVDMLINHALEDYEVREGYALTCQAVPASQKLVISYEG